MTFTSSNISSLELYWTIPAILAFLCTLGAMVWVLVMLRTLMYKIRQSPALYRAWGPRWNFLLFLASSLLFFALGWLGYAGIGFVAMATPPSVTPENQQAASIFAYILIAMEITHAIAQALLVGGLLALAGKWSIPQFDLRRFTA